MPATVPPVPVDERPVMVFEDMSFVDTVSPVTFCMAVIVPWPLMFVIVLPEMVVFPP